MRHTLYIILLLCAQLAVITSCTHCSQTNDNEKAKAAWQRYHQAYHAKNLNRALAVIDSMKTEEIVSTPKADHLRALVYDQAWQMKIAEQFYKKSYQAYASDPSQDWYSYSDAGYRWACLRLRRGDTSGALSVITQLLNQAKRNHAFPKSRESDLLMLLAHIQLQLHQFHEAQLTAQKAYQTKQQNAKHQSRKGWDIALVSMNISTIYHTSGDIQGALAWLHRCAQALQLAQQEHDDSLLIEEWKGHVALRQALLLQESGNVSEAAATYTAIPRSRLMEPNAYTEAAQYLMAAGRYNEAAYWYERIDSTYLATDGAKMTFDNIVTRLSPRYTAYRKAGRNADALLLADSVSVAIDSALVWQKQSDAAELAVIYQTHERDLQLKDLRFTISLHRLIIIAAAIIILLIAYLLWRAYKYNKVLAAKNRKLYQEIELNRQEQQHEMAQLQAMPEAELTTDQQLYRRICALMNEKQPYTDEALNRDSLAQMLGTNTKYLGQAIHECSHGESVGDFINRYRLEHVARLLKTTDDPIALIGELSGIPSRATLARLFRNAYGMTPTEYRQIKDKR